MSLAPAIYGSVAGLGGFVIAAIVLTILDLYLAGHGLRALSERRLLDAPQFGIHLSVSDGLALALGGIAALAVVLLTTKRRSHPTRR